MMMSVLSTGKLKSFSLSFWVSFSGSTVLQFHVRI